MKKELSAGFVLLLIFIGCTALYRGSSLPVVHDRPAGDSTSYRASAIPTFPLQEAAK